MALKLKLDIDVTGTNKTGQVFRAVGAAAEGVASKVTAISTAWIAFGRQIADAFAVPIRSAVEAESALNRLETALVTAGRDRGAADGLTAYADALERASGLSSESIQALEKRGLALGMTEEQTRALAEASVALAKATDIELGEASSQLVATLTGQAGQLRKNVEGVGGLTEAQLRHGEAIALVQAKYRSFITADAATTAGAWERLTIAVGNFSEALGLAILRGVNLPALGAGLVAAVERLTAALVENEPLIIRLVDAMTGLVVKGIEPTTRAFEAMLRWFDPISQKLDKLGATLTILLQPLKSFHAQLTALFSDTSDLDPRKNADNWEAWKRKLGLAGEGAKATAKNFRELQEAISTLFGRAEQGPPKSAMMPPGFAAAAEGSKAGAPKAPPFGGFAGLGRPSGADAAAEAARQLRTMLAAEEARQTSELRAEYVRRNAQIAELEAKAAKGSIDVASEAAKLRRILERELTRALAEEERKRQIEGRRRWFDAVAQTAQAMGDEVGVIRAGYERQIAELRRLKDEERTISEREYERRKAALDRQAAAESEDAARRRALSQAIADAAGGGTSVEDVDRTAKTALGWLEAAKGGVNEVLGKLGAMFGPIGQLISSVVQMLNQTPEQFRAFIQGLIQGVRELPKNIAANVPILIAEVASSLPSLISDFVEQWVTMVPRLWADSLAAAFETLPEALGKIFSAGFWAGIANGAFKALSDAFRNLWSVLFTGKPIKSALGKEAAEVKREAAIFGSDDPNAGGAEFKIKDASLRAERRATQRFEESFADTVEAGGKTFTDMLLDAWRDAMAFVSEVFGRIFQALRDAWLWIYDHVIAPLVEGIRTVWLWVYEHTIKPWLDLLTTLWRTVWDTVLGPFVTALGKAWSSVQENIVTPLVSGLVAVWRTAGEILTGTLSVLSGLLTTIGESLTAFTEALGAVWTAAKTAVVDPIVDFAKGVGATLLAAGSDFVATLTAALGPAYWREKGAAVWVGLSDAVRAGTATLWAWGARIWQGLYDAVAASIERLWAWGARVWEGFADAVRDGRSVVLSWGARIGEGLFDAVRDGRAVVLSWGARIWEGLYDAIGAGRNTVRDMGWNIWVGFQQAIQAGIQWLIDTFRDVFKSAITFGLAGGGGGGGGGFVDTVLGGIDGDRSTPFSRGGMVLPHQVDLHAAQRWAAAGVPAFAMGGMIPGFGSTDTVPALLTPGEMVLTKAQVAAMRSAPLTGGRTGGTQSTTINLNFNVSAGARLDREAIREVTPMIIEALNRESRNGTIVVRKNGIG